MSNRTAPPAKFGWLLGVLLAWFLLMGLVPGPERDTGSPELFDFAWCGYDSQYADALLTDLGAQGKSTYAYSRIPLDMVFPLLYGAVLFALIGWLAGLNGLSGAAKACVLASPVIAAAADLTENTLVFAMITSEPTRLDLARPASVATQVKWLAVLLSALTVVCLGVCAIWLRKR